MYRNLLEQLAEECKLDLNSSNLRMCLGKRSSSMNCWRLAAESDIILPLEISKISATKSWKH